MIKENYGEKDHIEREGSLSSSMNDDLQDPNITQEGPHGLDDDIETSSSKDAEVRFIYLRNKVLKMTVL